MRFLLSMLLLLAASHCRAGDTKYPVAAIPAPLLKGAHAVKRMEEIELRVVSTNEAVYRQKFAITVLDEEGADYAALTEGYDRLRKITELEGTLYDAQGNMLRKVKNKDIVDQSNISAISLMEDDRVKHHQFAYRDYPYTVEYLVEITYNNTLFFPGWMPQTANVLSVEQSRYTFVCPTNYEVRYKAFQYPDQPVVTMDKGVKRLQWQIKNKPAFAWTFASPGWTDLTTIVYFGPTAFEIQGYKGNMASWKDLGLFQKQLNAGRDVLPPNIVQAVQAATAGISDPKEKVAALYRYLQKNTRYISIQLGIGGWQPFEASFVANKGYGDCKALSNYMYSLLKAAGIPSNYAIVNGGPRLKDRIQDDFPINYFNHVVLCVPMGKDSIWLECTDQNSPPGYMGDFTGNRKALLITDDGGVLVSTPRYGVEANTQVRLLQAKLTDEGTLHAVVHTEYRGVQQDGIFQMLHYRTPDEIKKELNKKYNLGNYRVSDNQYKEYLSALPKIDEDLKIEAINYATITGKRLFITPNVLNREGARVTFDSTRTFDYVQDLGWRDEDKVVIDLPAGYVLEAGVKPVQIKNQFGSYAVSIEMKGNQIIYHRVREEYAGRFPPKEGKALVSFLEEIYKTDNSRLVFVKQ